jgi:hypothetical protein
MARQATSTQSGATVQSSLVTSTTSWRAARRPVLVASAMPRPAHGTTRTRSPPAASAAPRAAVPPLWSTTTISAGGGTQPAIEATHPASSSARPIVGTTTDTSRTGLAARIAAI